MSATISSINYCPVKSISFQAIEKCKIKKNVGIVGDRIFAFSKGLDSNQVKLFQNNSEERRGKWNNILTLKNSPILNKYNFLFNENKLTLTSQDEKILTINVNEPTEYDLLSNKILELESTLQKPIVLMRNNDLPFFDTSISNKTVLSHSVSLLNTRSVKDFQSKINQKIEAQRFIFRVKLIKKLRLKDLEPTFVLMELSHGRNGNGLEKLLKLMVFLLR